MMKSLNIIKIGGAIIENPKEKAMFLDEFIRISGPKILVHGGGRIASEFAQKMGIPVNIYNGRRITDRATLELVLMVYGGLVNKTMVADLLALNCPSIGLCGADAGLILAGKRKTSGTDYGFVGDLTHIDRKGIEILLDNKLVPVFSPISCTPEGQLLNTNADTIAAGIAVSFSHAWEVKLVYCFEKPGVMANHANEESVMEEISQAEYKNLLMKNMIRGGMIPKLDNCFNALEKGVKTVRIANVSGINRETGTLLKL